jgi:GTP-binding protein
MLIQSVEFVTSAGRARECPPGGMPEIAVSGRSNVGKSSLLNTLFARRNLVKVSGTPGKTQRLNFFRVNDRFHIVDLPGYGYARAPGAMRARWSAMMQEYLQHRRELVAMIQLVDCRHAPSDEDQEMVDWLRGERLPFALVATKVDKLAPTRVPETVAALAAALGLPAEQPVLAFSSHAGRGRPELLRWIEGTLAGGR